MPKYVKISKAKNLRFRLISVLYLLFISLSIIQIPIEWLRINPYYSNYMRAIVSKDAVAPELAKARKVIEEIDSSFVAFAGFDDARNTVREPAGYSTTDQFFIKADKANVVFTALSDLKQYYDGLEVNHPKRKEFERLFKLDLVNGLSDGKENIWKEWKFKHVPATVVRTLLAEFKLRLNLLNGAIELDQKKEESKSMIKLAFNVDLLQLGDTATFVVAQKKDLALSVKQGSNESNEYRWKGDTLYVIPKTTGMYQVDFTTATGTETVKINVEPTTFIAEKGEAVQFFYEGKESKLKYQNIGNIANVKCECAEASAINMKSGEVSFTPNKSGWCDFEIFSRTGSRVLFDSVYVQELPRPIMLASNVSAGRISRSRLLQEKGLRLTATHPDMDNFNYEVSKIKVSLIGLDNQVKNLEGAFIPLSAEELDRVKYIQINEVNVNTNVRNFKINEPLIIEII